jgi:hypothetical protein
LDNAPVHTYPRYIFDINRVIEEEAAETPLGLERKGIVGDGKLQKATVLRVLFEGKMLGAQSVIDRTSPVAGKIEDEIPLDACRITREH